MLGYIGSRLGRVVLTLIAVSIITFAMLKLVPGSFASLSHMNIGIGLGQVAGGAQSGSTTVTSGAAEPSAFQEYISFMLGLVTWHLPYTYTYPQLTIGNVIQEGFPITLTIATLSTILCLILAIPVGLIAAAKKDSILDRLLMLVSTALTALPGYLFVLILVLIFASSLKLLPTGGWGTPKEAIIPVVALALEGVAPEARYIRSSVLEQLREEYVVAALAKGGTRRTVMIHHVLRNSLIPLLTVAGPQFAGMLTGTVFIEALLRIPGLGLFFATAAQSRDMPLLMGSTLFFAAILVLMNLAVDFCYRILDPRIRYQNPIRTFRARREIRTRLKAVAANG